MVSAVLRADKQTDLTWAQIQRPVNSEGRDSGSYERCFSVVIIPSLCFITHSFVFCCLKHFHFRVPLKVPTWCRVYVFAYTLIQNVICISTKEKKNNRVLCLLVRIPQALKRTETKVSSLNNTPSITKLQHNEGIYRDGVHTSQRLQISTRKVSMSVPKDLQWLSWNI